MGMCALRNGCVAIGVTLGLLGAPAAQADNADFVRDAQAMGFVQRYDNLVSQAESACYFLWLHRNPQEIEERIVRYTRIDPPSKAHPFFVLAVKTYCPQYADRVVP
ncbi:DUF732 domain-containing protein [Mycobacterium sp.]|uniref:DUF732 domain-containing protein n=1 Tax=Mycobacterium sp. TaxID=1785 RepID=UPI0034387F86